VHRDRVFLVFVDKSGVGDEACAETPHPLVHLHGRVGALLRWLVSMITEHVPERQPV
jgi:hypothetical protein